jgi:hypothetical protein
MNEGNTEVAPKHSDVLVMTKEVVAHQLKLHAVLKRHIKEKNCKHCKKILKEAWGRLNW